LWLQLLGSKEWNASKKISVFLSMNDEISTVDILQSAFMANKECYIPRYAGSTMDMLRLYSWQDYESLPETSWKIKQPADEDNRESAFESGTLIAGDREFLRLM
jgi:5-formyltetrahydrofolate cyclo-ligase